MIYEYECKCGATFERTLPVSDYASTQKCECGKTARKIISRPALMIPQDIHYTSPIDGRPITSQRARADDLARSGCIPYDPAMKQDTDRRVREAEASLEKTVDDTVERIVSLMPGDKREKLQAELNSGLVAEPVRQTASLKSVTPLKGL